MPHINTTTQAGLDAVRVVAQVDLMPGQDDTNNVQVVEQGRFVSCRTTAPGAKVYCDGTVTGSQIAQTSGERVGDYLHGVLLPQGITWNQVSGVEIRDTTNFGITDGMAFLIKPNAASTVDAGVAAINAATDNGYAILPGTFIPLGLTAVNGWAMRLVNDATNDVPDIVLIGRFTA